MNRPAVKKYAVSVLLGLVCFALSRLPVTIDSAYDLYLLPGLLLPAVVALRFGTRYAAVCCTLGLAMFAPFVTVPTNGWGNLTTAVFLLGWAAGLGYCRDVTQRRRLPFFTLYIFQAAFIAVYFLCNKPLIQLLVRFNPPFWSKSYAFSYLPENLINASATILAETLTIAVLLTNSLLSLPPVKRLLGMKVTGYEKNSGIVLLVTGAVTVLVTTFSSSGVSNGMLSISFTVNAYQSSIGNMQFALLKIAAVLLLGDFLMHYLAYHNEQEQKTREMAETQKAVFESSDDLIFCVDAATGEILTCNAVAKAFFDARTGGFRGQRFAELFSDEDAVLWNDYFDETKADGDYAAEYYDAGTERYYAVQLHRIDLGPKKYEIAVFAKDITDDILLEDKTKQMNDELEIKVLERTKEMRSAYNEMEKMCFVIAHEFKSPVRAITLYNEIVAEECGANFSGEARDACRKITMYCEKTLGMISEILSYSKMNSSRLALSRVNMNRLVEDVIEELRMIDRTRDIRVAAARLPNVMGDEILLRCCVYNILANSVKYSSANPYTQIDIRFEDTPDAYVFYFKDSGAGFDMEYASSLFQMFNRMHKDTEFEGNGIGLVTVKSIIEKHGGTIGIDAKTGEGCTVHFTLPK